MLIGERQIVFDKDTEVLEINFDFIPGNVSGIITENGTPLEEAKVFVGRNRWIPTDADGKYFSALLPGIVNISAYTSQGVFVGKKSIEINENEEKIVNFNFMPASIRGSITKEGVPVEGAKIIIGSNAPILSDNQGNYFSKVLPGSVNIKVIYPGGGSINRKTIDVMQGDSFDLNFE